MLYVGPIHFIFSFLTSPINQGCLTSFIVVSKDSSNNTVTNYGGPLNFTSTDAQAVLPYGAATLVNGAAAFAAYFGTAGSQTITVTDSLNGATASLSNPLSVIATHLSIVAAPSSVNASSKVTVNVTALDPANNNVTAYTSTNSYGGVLKINSTDAQANYTGNTRCNMINGTGTFNVTLNTAGSQTINVVDLNFPGISGISNSIQLHRQTLQAPQPQPLQTKPLHHLQLLQPRKLKTHQLPQTQMIKACLWLSLWG